MLLIHLNLKYFKVSVCFFQKQSNKFAPFVQYFSIATIIHVRSLSYYIISSDIPFHVNKLKKVIISLTQES